MGKNKLTVEQSLKKLKGYYAFTSHIAESLVHDVLLVGNLPDVHGRQLVADLQKFKTECHAAMTYCQSVLDLVYLKNDSTTEKKS